jgi:hypothetical protein
MAVFITIAVRTSNNKESILVSGPEGILFPRLLRVLKWGPPLRRKTGFDCYKSLPFYWEWLARTLTNWLYSVSCNLAAKFLVALASTMIFGSESTGFKAIFYYLTALGAFRMVSFFLIRVFQQ